MDKTLNPLVGLVPLGAGLVFLALGAFLLKKSVWLFRKGLRSSAKVIRLAVNKEGVIRGNYYNALSDAMQPVNGSVDKKTQRAAWTVGDRKEPIYEGRFANLTKAETTMLVHFGKNGTQQWTLVRVEQPSEQK